MNYLTQKIKKIDLRKYANSRVPTYSCRYYIRLTKKYSLKLYEDKYEAYNILQRQTVAHSLDFAPKAINKIYKVSNYYGYITEHADINCRISDKDYEKIKNKISSICWSTYDIDKDHNLGKINNKVVLIDFDRGTLE